jgi:hypothetical protein
MGSGFGGAQTRKRPTAMTIGCLGPYPATRLVSGVLTDLSRTRGRSAAMVRAEHAEGIHGHGSDGTQIEATCSAARKRDRGPSYFLGPRTVT